MATTIAQATPEVLTPHKTVKIAGLQIRETPNGTVAFINTNYVSQKLIDIMVYALSDKNYALARGENYGHGVYSVIFRMDNMPVMPMGKGKFEEVPWLWVEASKSAICNIKRCVSLSFEQALDKHDDFKHSEHMSVKTAIWQQILASFLHECHHAEVFMDSAMKMLTDKQAMEQEEIAADEYGRLELYELAKHIDIEPDLGKHIEELYEAGWQLVWEELMTMPEKEQSGKIKRYLVCQEKMKASGGMWFMEATKSTEMDHSIMTYKEMLHYFSGDEKDDPEWGMNTQPPNTTTVVHENTPSMEDAYGNPGISYDNVPNGFQGAMPQQQNMGYSPQAQHEPRLQQQYQQVQPQGNMPKAPEGAIGQAGPVAPNYQQPNVPAGTDYGVNPNCQVGANVYPASTLNAQDFQRVVKNLYYKIYAHIFQSCGFNPMNGPGQPFFMQSAKIVEPIMLDQEEQKIVKGMECYDENGKIQLKVKVNGWISGRFIDSAKLLPGFALTMSNINGTEIMRKFLPQNPWKINKNGGFSGTAQLAQQGTQILWIVDPMAKDSQFATRIIGGQLETNVGGSWQPVC